MVKTSMQDQNKMEDSVMNDLKILQERAQTGHDVQ